MNAGNFIWLLLFVVPAAGLFFLLLTGQTRGQRAAPLFDALREFAANHPARLEELDVIHTVQVKAHSVVAGEACFVQLGWENSDFTLRLQVDLPGLTREGFEECWDRDWVRYLKRDYDQRIFVTSGTHFLSLSGPSHSLRETFAEVDLADMARLFGAPPRGPGQEQRRVSVQDGNLSVLVDFPDLRHMGDLAGQLAALVRLAKFSVRPFGEEQSARPTQAPQSVGKVMVSVQPGQRCSFCREDLIGGDVGPVKTCAACNSSLHAACLAEHGGCCTVGCRNNPRER